jgi:hypothetical protein
MSAYYSLLFPKNWDDPLSMERLDDLYRAKYAELRNQILEGTARAHRGPGDAIPDPDPHGVPSGLPPVQWPSSASPI